MHVSTISVRPAMDCLSTHLAQCSLLSFSLPSLRLSPLTSPHLTSPVSSPFSQFPFSFSFLLRPPLFNPRSHFHFLAFTVSPHFSPLTTLTFLEPAVPEYDRPYVIRSKGFFWLASRTDEMMLWYVRCLYLRIFLRSYMSFHHSTIQFMYFNCTSLITFYFVFSHTVLGPRQGVYFNCPLGATGGKVRTNIRTSVKVTFFIVSI